jgi:hypothetical protein
VLFINFDVQGGASPTVCQNSLGKYRDLATCKNIWQMKKWTLSNSLSFLLSKFIKVGQQTTGSQLLAPRVSPPRAARVVRLSEILFSFKRNEPLYGFQRQFAVPLFRCRLGAAELEPCALNAYCSNSFVFGKNCPNFD